MNNRKPMLIYHPSVETVLLTLRNQGLGENAGYLIAVMKQLENENPDCFCISPYKEFDFNDCNTLSKWIDVAPVHSLDTYDVQDMFFRGKILPNRYKEIDTQHRIIFFYDRSVGRIIYLYLGVRKSFDYDDIDWKRLVKSRYKEYLFSTRAQYIKGENPFWSSP